MAISFTLPKWYDLHTHFRQGKNVNQYIADHLAMGCAGALAMPNTRPPVSQITGKGSEDACSIESYRAELLAAGADVFDQLITPLYLTDDTTAEMIAEGAGSGLLQAAKYYPPHGTTNAEHGVAMDEWIGGDVFRAMEDYGVVLCIHGEQHGLVGADYFDAQQSAESVFYNEKLPAILEAHPRLRLVCEHITTSVAVDFVAQAPERVAATVTPQHLLYTVGDLIQGLKYHLYCLPLVKFDADREALRVAVTQVGQNKFFAGTDSAPHTSKVLDCGCAAGCYTGACAPQLYAMAFEQAGVDFDTDSGCAVFESFLSTNGPTFYGFASSEDTFTLSKAPSQVAVFESEEGPVVPLPVGMDLQLTWSIEN
ncbi:MAG: dihydroorotase [Verrucomicrobiota bacterium]